MEECEHCLLNKTKILKERPKATQAFTCIFCENEGMKMCRICDMTGDLELFRVKRNTCRECENNGDREKHKKKNPDAVRRKEVIFDGRKECNKCDKFYDLDEFPKGKNTCKPCKNKRARELREQKNK